MYSMSQFAGRLLSDEESIKKYNDEKQWGLHIAIDLGEGDATARMWTCDFTHGYITINGDYRT